MNTRLNDATEDARCFVNNWMKEHFKNKTFTKYIETELAGDFAYNLANALRANTPESSAAQGAMGELIGAQSRCYELHPKTLEVLKVREWFDLPIRHGSYEESARISMTFNGTDGAPRGYETRMIYAVPFGRSANIAQPSDATAQPHINDLPYDEKTDVLRISRFVEPRVDLTDEHIEAAAKVMAECFDYPWKEMPEQGKATMRKHVRSILDAALANTAQGKPTISDPVCGYCKSCNGSGEGVGIEGRGPDVYEVPINCPTCSGTGEAQLRCLPEISDEDKAWLHYNPNTSDVIEWIENYARQSIALAAKKG